MRPVSPMPLVATVRRFIAAATRLATLSCGRRPAAGAPLSTRPRALAAARRALGRGFRGSLKAKIHGLNRKPAGLVLAIDIGADTHASILPFAQGRNMMARFMEGVDPDYQRLIENTLGNVFDKALDQTIDAIDELDAARKECYKRQAKLAGEQALSNYVGGLAESRQVYFVGPVMDVVASLPKDELAEMAESLVNLTSLKMRMSNDKETVGGPIDVAIISKGDGLVWTKRKHYFRPELNPHFFANYHREDDGDGCEAQAKGG